MSSDLMCRRTGRRVEPPLKARLRERRGEAGQAAVEFVALLPLLLLVGLAAAQGAVAGYTQWSAAGAARIAARAEALERDATVAAKRSLPQVLTHGLRVRSVKPRDAQGGRAEVLEGTVEVQLRVPSLVPGLTFGRVSARAQLPWQGEG